MLTTGASDAKGRLAKISGVGIALHGWQGTDDTYSALSN